MVKRYLEDRVRKDLEEKMVYISGPRQVGKTTLAKSFLGHETDRYYNWDRREDRKEMLLAKWPAVPSTVVLDEIHKYRRWKNWVKGEYDTHGDRVRFLITGSARLDIYRKGGDSLQGRYHSHRLHGFSLGELLYTQRDLPKGKELDFPETSDHETLKALLHYGPFPEPFLKKDERTLRRWRQDRLDRFFREDVRELEIVRDLSSMELLAGMLEERVGGLLSLQSLREDLEVSHRAVSHWMDILDRLYLCYRIPPFAHRAVRSLRKAHKVYLWDWSSVPDAGPRFENLVAGHLLKLRHALEDQEGYRVGLHYLRDASKREVDFFMTFETKPWFAVECKVRPESASPALEYFGERIGIPYLFQIHLEGKEDVLDGKVRLMPAARFLAALP
ncbi:MAG: ATP-binding protein [Deltaproteobacteria bacterium]